MTDLDSGDTLGPFVDRAGSLYSLPSVAIEVLELTDRPNVDLRALKQCIERDPALTAKILRVVNSSMFGLGRAVSDLNQALTLLGVAPLKLLVLGFSLPESLFSDIEADMLERFWRFALVKAVAARRLAVRFWAFPPDEAFVAGLLQEIGTLLLIRELGDPYVHFLKNAIAMGDDVTPLEDSVLGFNHAQLSTRLLDKWNLPKSIVAAVSQPHDVEHLLQLPADQQALPQILHIATLIASLIVDRRTGAMSDLLAAGDRYRQISIDQLDTELDELQEQVELMAGAFEVPINNPLRYRDILADAQRAIAGIAPGAISELLTGSGAGADPAHADRQMLTEAANELSHAAQSSSADLDATSSAPRRPVAVETTKPAVATIQQQPAASPTSDPGLAARLTNAISMARVRRCELSLVLLEVTNFDDLVVVAGPDATDAAVQALAPVLNALAGGNGAHLLISDYRYASVLLGYDRRRAVEFGRRLVQAAPPWSVAQRGFAVPMQCCAAIVSSTLPGRAYATDEFTEAAERCLFAARASGSGSVKSINLF